jgi:hypothetical protein
LVHQFHHTSDLEVKGEAVAAQHVATGDEEACEDLTVDWTCDVLAGPYQQDSVVPVSCEHDGD